MYFVLEDLLLIINTVIFITISVIANNEGSVRVDNTNFYESQNGISLPIAILIVLVRVV
jgi:hypothetical protein